MLSVLALGILPGVTASAPAHVHPTTIPAASGPWLDRFNAWRANAGLSTLTENPTYSSGDAAHALYMVQTGQVTHSESTAYSQYTAAGDTAARNSNIYVSSSTSTTDADAIDFWMQAPFHALGMLDPRLGTTGFGSYRNSAYSSWAMGAAVNVLQGNSFSGGVYPVYFPGNNSTQPLTQYGGGESPNPLQGPCAGYSAPTGLPVFVEIGGNIATTAGPVHTFTGNGTPLAHCVLDSNSPNVGSNLTYRGGVVLIPQAPLQAGVRYVVTLTVNNVPYTWSFSVGAFVVPPPAPGWVSLGGYLTSSPAAVTAGGSDDVFVKGTDSGIWRAQWNGVTSGGWVPGGGILTADPAAVSLAPGVTKVAVRGTDRGLWLSTWNGSTFSSWTPMGGILTSAPTADVRAGSPGSIDLFVRGTDNGLWRRWSDDGGVTWSNWLPLGGIMTSDPGAASWSSNRIDVVVRGTDNGVWMRSWDSATGWNNWANLGGYATSAPAITSCASGHLDIFVRGTDNGLWQLGFNGTSWTGWKSLGGNFTSNPTATCRVGSTIDLFARYTDYALWTKSIPGS
jgi:hypothetical protein